MRKTFGIVSLFFIFSASFLVTNASSNGSTQAQAVKGVPFMMAYIPPGEFLMGSPKGEGLDREQPQHRVRITKGFWIGQTEVTQALWQAVMGSNPSYFAGCNQCPVERVRWNDCQEFLQKLNSLTGGSFRLPTAAEWEYAARAGTTTTYSFGNDASMLGTYAWFWNNDKDKTNPVAQKKPNAWGLYDMHGSVWEWCQDYHDYYGPTYYSQSPVDDPRNDTESPYRELRGGSWVDNPDALRCAFRLGDFPDCLHNNFGLRLAHSTALPPGPKDSDGDGVIDDLDKCPDTPRGVKVDDKGCPLDSDGDGVPDYLDQCPDTPKGVKVDEKGCPLDSDGDGVPDYLDQCPGTPKGAKVDKRGCWVIGDVKFDFDKWDIKPIYHPSLDEVITVLKNNPALKAEIQGHTDDIGTAEYNQKLSEKRAKAVMDYFVKKGIQAARLSAVGFGFSKPIDSRATPEARAQNRRVELKPIP